MISPFEINPHYDERSTDNKKVVAMFEHDIRRLLIYICKEGNAWNRIYIHYDELENHIVQQV